MIAAAGPSKARNGLTCVRMRSTHSATTAGSFRVRSALAFGSPISPVAPPTRAIGRCPARWRRRIVSSWTRLPTCRLGAVGSNPQ